MIILSPNSFERKDVSHETTIWRNRYLGGAYVYDKSKKLHAILVMYQFFPVSQV